MEELQSKYVGYNSFQNKDKTKTLYVIQILLQDVTKTSVKSTLKDIFVDKDVYDTIINSVKPFDNIPVIRTVDTVNDKVYYKLK